MEDKKGDTIVNEEEIKLYEGNEYVQLLDIYNLMEKRIEALRKKVNSKENSGELRVVGFQEHRLFQTITKPRRNSKSFTVCVRRRSTL